MLSLFLETLFWGVILHVPITHTSNKLLLTLFSASCGYLLCFHQGVNLLCFVTVLGKLFFLSKSIFSSRARDQLDQPSRGVLESNMVMSVN
jgi:hypothetical protein